MIHFFIEAISLIEEFFLETTSFILLLMVDQLSTKSSRESESSLISYVVYQTRTVKSLKSVKSQLLFGCRGFKSNKLECMQIWCREQMLFIIWSVHNYCAFFVTSFSSKIPVLFIVIIKIIFSFQLVKMCIENQIHIHHIVMNIV